LVEIATERETLLHLALRSLRKEVVET
jgi:hypothetical protein